MDKPGSVDFLRSPHKRCELVLFDAEAMMHRAFHAGQNKNVQLQSQKTNEDTTATFFFCRTLLRCLEKTMPSYAVLVSGGHQQQYTFRHELSNGAYKSARTPLLPGMQFAFRRMAQVARVCFQLDEYSGAANIEADDIIATMTHSALKQGFNVSIVSPDKDFNQLLDDAGRVCVRWLSEQEVVTIQANDVCSVYGIHPSQFADYLALAGDRSDSIPGVHGIGHKRAVQLLQQYGSIDAIFSAVDNHVMQGASFTPRAALKPLLSSGAYESAFTSRQLSTLVCDASDVDTSFDAFAWDASQCGASEHCHSLLVDELDFQSLREPLNRLQSLGMLSERITHARCL